MGNTDEYDWEELKKGFIRNEVFGLTVAGAFQRGNVYAENIPEAEKKQLRGLIRKQLDLLVKQYGKEVGVEQHVKFVQDFATRISRKYDGLLRDGNLRIGTAQKLVGLYLKYQWSLGWKEEPAVCPFDDYIINRVLRLNRKWTEFDETQYREVICAAQEQARQDGFDDHLGRWELWKYEERNEDDP